MTPEEKSLLERTYKLTDENNRMLRGIRRSNRISSIMRVIYWVVIIGLSVEAYYFIQPFAVKALDLYNQASGNVQSDSNAFQNAAQSFDNLFKGPTSPK